MDNVWKVFLLELSMSAELSYDDEWQALVVLEAPSMFGTAAPEAEVLDISKPTCESPRGSRQFKAHV